MSLRLLTILSAIFLLFSAMVIMPDSGKAETGTWSVKSPMPTARYAAGSVVCGGQIWVMGGMGGNYSNHYAVSANEVYTPSTDTWSTRAPLPTPRWGLVAAVVYAEIYAIGGANETGTLDVVEAYNTITDTWRSAPSLPTGRVWSGVSTLDHSILVLGGSLDGGSTSTDEVLFYNENYGWLPTTSLMIPRQLMGVATVESDVYLFGGWRGRAEVERYDFLDASSTTMNPLPYGVSGAGAVRIKSKIYIAGGAAQSECDPLGLVYEFDPASNEYEMASPMLLPRHSMAVGTVHDMMYAIGGSHACEATSDTQEFSPAVEENNPPSCSIYNLSDEQLGEGFVNIRGNATDPDGNDEIVKVEVDIDGFGWIPASGKTHWNYSWDTTDAKPGYHTIHARAYDGQEYSTHYWIVVEIPQPETVAEEGLLLYALLGVVIFLILMVLGLFFARPRSRR